MSIIHVEANNSENAITFFTRQEDGESGMTITALSKFCGVAQHVVTELLNKIRDSEPIVNSLPECLKPFAGKEQRVIVNEEKNSLYVKDELCHAILEYYTFDAREYKGKSIAIQNYKTFAKAGIRVYIWSQTGYNPQSNKLRSEISELGQLVENLQNEVEALKNNQKQLAATRGNYQATPEKIKIFEDLVKLCKGQAITTSQIRTSALLRRKDVRMIFGDKAQARLLKAQTLLLFKDAAKHGFGTFDKLCNVFKPA